MAFVLADRVRETTTTAGTGAVSLAGAVSGFQAFSAAIGNANNTYYTIADPTTGAWEVGIGTYTSSGNTLSRDTVLSSSNSGSLVNFASNSKDVFVTQPASRAVFVQNAGTGLQTGTTAFTANRVIYSDATSTTATSASLTFDGTTLTSAAFSGPLNGTVGATTPNTGAFTSIVSTSALGILTRAAANQDGVVLLGRSGGTGSFEVALTPTTLTTDRTLTLPDNSGTVLTTGAVVTVPQGGTGLTSGTSGGVPYFVSTSAITSSGLLNNNDIMLGGGPGGAPKTTSTGAGVVSALASTANTNNGLVTQTGTLTSGALLRGNGATNGISSITTGTGVLTALGVNTGTAGAFVVNGGALGTPSSGTVTNLTGTASININGTVGATTPNTGAFTTISATGDGTFSGTGQVKLPTGTTAQRSGSPTTGMIRYNTSLSQFEGYNGTIWGGIGGAQAGGAIVTNKTDATVSYTIATGENGMSVGPVTIASGVTVTVSSGQRWLVL